MPAVMVPIQKSACGDLLCAAIEDRVLAEPAGGERECPRSPALPQSSVVERDRHLLPQAAHLAHVLLAAERVNHATGSEEEQRLEERVRHHDGRCRRRTRRRRRPRNM